MELVCDVMTRGVRALSPTDTLQLAAQAMEELAVGAVPICDGQRLVGMVTDRDLTVRGMAQGLDAKDTPLSQVMTDEVRWCYADQSVEEAARTMRDAQVRRLPVVDRDKRLVGMLSLGDVAVKSASHQAASALQDISQPAEPDRSGLSAASGSAGGGADAGAATKPR